MTSILNTPMLWVNHYIQDQLKDLGFGTIPFFPATPSTVNDISGYFPENGVMCTYDKMFKARRSPFPHIKSEQGIYYFYATAEEAIVSMVKISEKILRLMDREDETAEEINNWCRNQASILVEGEYLTPNFNFHHFKLYQLQEVKDIINFNTVRTYSGTKFIIEYDYNAISL